MGVVNYDSVALKGPDITCKG